jgi:hypothetical protein
MSYSILLQVSPVTSKPYFIMLTDPVTAQVHLMDGPFATNEEAKSRVDALRNGTQMPTS